MRKFPLNKKNMLFLFFLLCTYAATRFVYFKYHVPFPGRDGEGVVCTAAAAVCCVVYILLENNVAALIFATVMCVGMCFYSPPFGVTFFPAILCVGLFRTAKGGQASDRILYPLALGLFACLLAAEVIVVFVRIARNDTIAFDTHREYDMWYIGLIGFVFVIFAILFSGSFRLHTQKQRQKKRSRAGRNVTRQTDEHFSERLHTIYLLSMAHIIMLGIYCVLFCFDLYIKDCGGVWLMAVVSLIIDGEPYALKIKEKMIDE